MIPNLKKVIFIKNNFRTISFTNIITNLKILLKKKNLTAYDLGNF